MQKPRHCANDQRPSEGTAYVPLLASSQSVPSSFHSFVAVPAVVYDTPPCVRALNAPWQAASSADRFGSATKSAIVR